LANFGPQMVKNRTRVFLPNQSLLFCTLISHDTIYDARSWNLTAEISPQFLAHLTCKSGTGFWRWLKHFIANQTLACTWLKWWFVIGRWLLFTFSFPISHNITTTAATALSLVVFSARNVLLGGTLWNEKPALKIRARFLKLVYVTRVLTLPAGLDDSQRWSHSDGQCAFPKCQ